MDDVVAGAVGGAVMAAILAVWHFLVTPAIASAMPFKRRQRVVALPASPPPVVEDSEHEHDWHIREKRLGVVWQYCLGCALERVRPEG